MSIFDVNEFSDQYFNDKKDELYSQLSEQEFWEYVRTGKLPEGLKGDKHV